MPDNEIAALSIIGEDSIEYNYYVVCRFTANGHGYIALTPQDSSGSKIELYRCTDNEDGNLQLSNITSDFELDDVKREYGKMIGNEPIGISWQNNGIDDVITITDSDGAGRTYEVVTVFNYEGLDCIALMPLECPDSPASPTIELFAYHVIENGDGFSIEEIPEMIFGRVQEYFIALVENSDGE